MAITLRCAPPSPPYSLSFSLYQSEITIFSGPEMTVVAAAPPGLRRIPIIQSRGRYNRWAKGTAFPVMMDGSLMSHNDDQKELISALPQMQSTSSETSPTSKAHLANSCNESTFHFDRLQALEEGCNCRHKRVFGPYVAREVLLDEEYWAAAWLRAESHWENQTNDRYVQSFMKQFAEQEFNALKKRCNRQHAEKCICMVAVKNDEKNSKRNILNSIVGTLDLNIRHLLCGEKFPGERVKSPMVCGIYQTDQPRYSYVANLCVPKPARRQGIASNLLLLALEAAVSYGTNQIYVHVQKDNFAARKLYDQLGFQIVEIGVPHLSSENKYLLCLSA